MCFFFFSSRRRHTRWPRDWSSDVCSSDLDELRRMDWVPRSVHTKARKVQAVMQQIEQAKGRVATDEEMARALKISVEEYQQWLEEIRPVTFVCLDAAHNN